MDTVKCHQELQAAGQRVSSILKSYIKFNEDVDDELMNPAMRTTIAEVKCWITKDCMEPQRSNVHFSQGRQKDSIEPYYYLRRHPILCGMMKFRFSLTMNELGLAECNQWGATSKLYSSMTPHGPLYCSIRSCAWRTQRLQSVLAWDTLTP